MRLARRRGERPNRPEDTATSNGQRHTRHVLNDTGRAHCSTPALEPDTLQPGTCHDALGLRHGRSSSAAHVLLGDTRHTQTNARLGLFANTLSRIVVHLC